MSDTPLVDNFAATPRGLGTGYYQALKFASDLERKLQQSEAQAAVMREALTDAENCDHTYTQDVRDKIHAALQSTAGEQLLREVERMRKAIKDHLNKERWSCGVTTGVLETDKDGPWILADHEQLTSSIS